MSALTLPAPINPDLDLFVNSVLAAEQGGYLEKFTRGIEILAEQQQQQAPAPRERDPERDAYMATREPSRGQWKRINRMYEAAGLRPFATFDAFQSVFPTMLDASLEYDALKS